MRTRGSIKTGTYVCMPTEQGGALLATKRLVIGRVVTDHRDEGGWDDNVKVKLMKPLPLHRGEPSPLGDKLWSLLRIRVPKECDGDGSACDALRGGQARGLLYADCEGGPELMTTASRLLEIKVVEIPLTKSASVGQDGMSTTARLVQLDEDLDAGGAHGIWNAGWIEDGETQTTFDFPERDGVIGLGAAEERGWATDWTAWGDLVRQQEHRRERGLRTTLLAISDGSVLGKGFSASSTYGWVCYALATEEHTGERKETGPGADRGHVMAGGGKVAGPPEWTSSTRAEATGLLAALMGIITAGWQGDIELRLDNDSAVGRAGGLVLEAASDSRTGTGDEDLPEQVLRDAMTIENSDIWTEFVSWRDEVRRTGARVRVVWHPGHPERRKAADRSDWNQDDHAIFLADEIADAMHSIPEQPRQPTQWSHQPAWNLQWRGTTQIGCIAQRLHDAVRTEQLASYLQGTGLGKGADGGWLIPELISRTIARKEGTLGRRVHRAKVVASILGTKYTQHRRNGLGEDDDPMCRLCGNCLETDNHVLWECTHRGPAKVRRELVKAVNQKWREAGLGQRELTVARLLWAMNEEDAVLCKSTSDIRFALGPDCEDEATRLTDLLIGHTLDATGMALERNGIFGKGWIELLADMGLGRPAALDALVAVASVLQGQDGTIAVWEAFTGSIEGASAAVLCETDESATPFMSWAVDVRALLRQLSTQEDEPYRALSRMVAAGMTAGDREEFGELVQGWLVLQEIDDDTKLDWADSLPDAVLRAMAHVTGSRQRRGLKQIRALDIARADAKVAAEERRTRQGLSVVTGQGTKRFKGGAAVGGMRTKHPRQDVARGTDELSKRSCTRHKAAKTKRVQGGVGGQGKRSKKDTRADKRTNEDDESGCRDSKRRNETTTAPKRKQEDANAAGTAEVTAIGAGDEGARGEEGNKRPYSRSTAGKHDRDEEEATERGARRTRSHSRQEATRRARDETGGEEEQTSKDKRHRNTRERCSVGTSQQEPD
jgi:hypothetical protein